MKKGIAWSVVSVMFVFVLFAAGCSRQGTAGTGNGKIVFTNWVSVEEGTQAGMLALIDAFQKENPGITVDNQGIAVNDMLQQLTVRSAARNAPDMSQVFSDNVGQLQSAGFIAQVDDLLSPSFRDDMFSDLWNVVGLIEGSHYAVPWTNSSNGFFYNKKLMSQAGLDPSKPPRTIDELTAMMRIAKERLPDDVIMLQADTTVRAIGLQHQWTFMLAFNDGVPLYTLDGKVNFNTPGMKAYMEWVRMLVNEKLTLPGLRYGQFRPYAAQGKLLFAHDGSFFEGLVRALDESNTLTAEVFYETWGATVPPAGKDGVFRVPAQTHSLVILDQSQNKEAVAKLIEYLVSSDNALNNYIAVNGFTPVIRSAAQRSPGIANNPIISAFLDEVVPASVYMPTGPDYALYADIIMAGVQEAITTNRSIDAILEQGQRRLEELFR